MRHGRSEQYRTAELETDDYALGDEETTLLLTDLRAAFQRAEAPSSPAPAGSGGYHHTPTRTGHHPGGHHPTATRTGRPPGGGHLAGAGAVRPTPGGHPGAGSPSAATGPPPPGSGRPEPSGATGPPRPGAGRTAVVPATYPPAYYRSAGYEAARPTPAGPTAAGSTPARPDLAGPELAGLEPVRDDPVREAQARDAQARHALVGDGVAPAVVGDRAGGNGAGPDGAGRKDVAAGGYRVMVGQRHAHPGEPTPVARRLPSPHAPSPRPRAAPESAASRVAAAPATPAPRITAAAPATAVPPRSAGSPGTAVSPATAVSPGTAVPPWSAVPPRTAVPYRTGAPPPTAMPAVALADGVETAHRAGPVGADAWTGLPEMAAPVSAPPAVPAPGRTRPGNRLLRRIPGRHAALSCRQPWEGRYIRALLLGDLGVGIAAGASTFALRFGETVTSYNRGYLLLSVLLPAALLAVLGLSRAYERRFLYVGTEEYQRVFRGGLGLTAAAAIVSYALDLSLARSYVLAALPLATCAAVVLRFGLRRWLHRARSRGECLRRVIVVGHELAVVGITRQLRRERYHGLEVVGACLPPRHDGNVGLPVYGTFDDVADAVEAAAADTVVVLSCPELDGHVLRRLAWRLERDDIDLIVASALIDVAGARTTIRPVDGLPMLHVEHPRLDGGARLVKEAVDRIGAVLLVALLGPVLLGVAACVRFTSPGPVLFRQVRIGRDGQPFRMIKFRSMYVDAEARLAELRHLNEYDGVLFKMRDDPRVTPVGRWLRRFSLDELPQLFNVLSGRMSLVGPRPPLPAEVAAYAADVRRRLAVKPGMTGLWQVSGRSDLPWEEAVRLDLRYVENWSLSLDLVIMLRTMTAVVRSSGAY